MSDEEQERKTALGREAKWTETTLVKIMDNADGRWWMASLLERCNTFSTRYRFDGDALGAMFRDGMADVGHFLLEQLDTHTPDQYQRMIRERRARLDRMREKAEAERKAAEEDRPVTAVAEDLADAQAVFYAKKAAQKQSDS